MTTPIQIRIASASDLDSICKLSEQINHQHHEYVQDIFVELADNLRERAFWQTAMEAPNSAIFLACANQAVLGFISLRWTEDTANPFLCVRKICRIGTIVVADHQHQQGIGKLLMDAATAWGREHRTVEMRLEVFDFNRNALAFYEHLGFSVQTHIMRKLMGETE
ncbi:MAG: GNAT family N-acetyltransferase [Undibacterium sp.]|uniref:GNAT family N-acetyltransferase n=1 Tax=Undibacterium sp. TaxID=1914977 RepID=UPI002728A8BC|nr:GNAT family N-acetyltransferase [Undibacterium sp.]MDO8654725.1 GNAT family N-acetyltransferase [Undibacterium sp.]